MRRKLDFILAHMMNLDLGGASDVSVQVIGPGRFFADTAAIAEGPATSLSALAG
jgi:hypothetical protein